MTVPPENLSKSVPPDRLPFLSLDEIWAAIRDPAAAGNGLLVTPPPIYTELFERARAAGFRVRNLYMLRRHVAMSRAACWDAMTGDIWIQQGTEANLYYLIHELAHAARNVCEPGRAIDRYHEDETEAIKYSRTLAVEWGVAEEAPPELIERLLNDERQHEERARRVAYLIGTMGADFVNRADEGLLIWTARHHWRYEDYVEALHHDADTPLLDIDRSFLMTGGHIRDLPAGDPLGKLALPVTKRSGQRLRRALRRVAEKPGVVLAHKFAPLRYICLGEVGNDEELAMAIQGVQDALVVHFDLLPKVTWWCYGSTPAPNGKRLYRMLERFPGEKKCYEIWTWFKRGAPDGLEAAFQRYIRSWGCAGDILTGTYLQGKRLLDRRIKHLSMWSALSALLGE